MSETFRVLSALKPDGMPTGVLVHESEYEGDPSDWFVAGRIEEGSARDEGTVEVSGSAVNAMEIHYEAAR